MKGLNPCGIIIFGASGDLAHIKIFPALYNLWDEGFFPDNFFITGFARTKMDDEQFRKTIYDSMNIYCRKRPIDVKHFKDFSKHINYLSMSYNDIKSYESLKTFTETKSKEYGMPKNLIFYLSTPPSVYQDVVEGLNNSGLASNKEQKDGFSRIVIEKPFGYDYETANELNSNILAAFQERQIYRIDHYLGKETVQNILAFRFANAIFEPVWNNKYIDHIQISALESIGVGSRAGYFDNAGIIRDMMQNHMLQLLSLVAIEPPAIFDADDLSNEKAKLLKSVRRLTINDVRNNVVRGQYDRGTIGDNEEALSYREEKGIPVDSITDTYVALKLYIDNYRWAGVPFYIRSGKRIKEHKTEIAIYFKKLPHSLFGKNSVENLEQNIITITIQPNEGIELKIGAKSPGFKMEIEPVELSFFYKSSFKGTPPEAYERLLYDIMEGDQTLFYRTDNMLISWKLIGDIINGWKSLPAPMFPNYESGSWGPKEADELINKDGRAWHNEI